MSSQRPNPFGYATPLGEGLSSVFSAFLSAPTPEDRAANALKIHGLQAGAKRDLAAAGYDDARTAGQTISNDALRALPTLDFNAPDAQGRVMQTMGGNYGSLADVFATHQALRPGVTLDQMDPIVYAKTGNAGNTMQGTRMADATTQRGQDVTAATTRRGQDLTHQAAIYNTDQTQSGLDRRFSVNTPANSITTVPASSPIATSPTGNTTIEGIRTNADGTGSQTPKNYRTPDNKSGITYDGLTDAVTKQPLPQGTQLAGTVSASGFTEAQTKDAAWAVRLETGLNNWKELSVTFDPTSAKDFLIQDAKIPWTDLTIGNAMISPERQRYQQAAREILAVVLRKDTGAAITPSEVEYYGPMVLPMPFDDPATLNQKVASINALRATLMAGGGPAYEEAKRLQSQPGFSIDVPFANAASGATPRPGDVYVPQGAGPTQNAAQELQDAQAAIARGADRAAVAARYKQRTGQDLP